MDLVKRPPTLNDLGALCRKLGVRPREILRKRDPAYAANDLASGAHSDRQLLALMAAHPGLIQRPIIVSGRRALVARSPDALAKWLE